MQKYGKMLFFKICKHNMMTPTDKTFIAIN